MSQNGLFDCAGRVLGVTHIFRLKPVFACTEYVSMEFILTYLASDELLGDNAPDYPVIILSWDSTLAFCRKVWFIFHVAFSFGSLLQAHGLSQDIIGYYI